MEWHLSAQISDQPIDTFLLPYISESELPYRLQESACRFGRASQEECRENRHSTKRPKRALVHQVNPNGGLPVLVDRAREEFVVFETAAILLNLQQHYDPERKLGFDSVSA
ncbi:hypothetical protein CY34DRAFT_18313 [Suillus luteus UH-Slu-Lm8-n1]|uniref:GST N-terminal domain-containing protein n=1 Tax=Suillus luteus UH-Slu-Lm8-n1 TaxID=930992 RepID=A0A0C9ZVY0_9AGAM|nr:hypothetical protein CY34DRAFT_18444 [Suillus luteus UH-Slu-Lm8-n1]KIK33536.1 hypothetical protein CY34DRAFT_18313 [Suillus luteus UH-Slu-Lm8-n1]